MKLTKQQISELTDTQLNRAMLDNYMSYWNSDKDILKAVQKGEFNYLENWSLLMPLVVENELEHGHIIGSQGAHYAIYLTPYIGSKVLEVSRDKSLQRAYAEALVYLKVGV